MFHAGRQLRRGGKHILIGGGEVGLHLGRGNERGRGELGGCAEGCFAPGATVEGRLEEQGLSGGRARVLQASVRAIRCAWCVRVEEVKVGVNPRSVVGTGVHGCVS